MDGQFLNISATAPTIRGSLSRENGKSWDICREKIRQEIPGTFFETFIAPLRPLPAEGGDLHLVADEKMIPYIQDRYLSLIQRTLNTLEFRGQVSLIASHRTDHLPDAAGATPDSPARIDDCNTETIVPHPENSAQIALLRSLEFPGCIACVTGPSGSGKTALSRIIARDSARKGLRIERMRIEDFLINFTESIRDRSTVAWKLKLRDADLILFDDFQYLKKSAIRSQEELRNLFDHFLENGKRAILFSDSPFQNLEMREDLSSRLSEAYPVQLRIPNKDGRVKILEAECDRLNFHPEGGVLDHLAERIDEDVRRLKSALLRLKHNGMKRIPDRMLDDLYSDRITLDPEVVMNVVSLHSGVSVEAIRGPARDKKISLARHTCAYFLIEQLGMKLVDVARMTGRKDHAAVIHARKKIEEMIQNDLFFMQEIGQIRIKIEKESLSNSGKRPKIG
jgi:chromosomal replication initiation ATPase DnaA